MQTDIPTRLFPLERRVIMALVEAMAPPGDKLRTTPDEAYICDQVGLALASMGWDGRLVVRSGLWIFELATVIRFLRPFSTMSLDARSRWLARTAESGLSLVRLGVRLLLTMGQV